MSTSIPQAFIDLFGAETKKAYQREGSKLRGMLRIVSAVGGSTYRFPRLGAGVATQKARHADVTPMNLAHSNRVATLEDFYASEYVDELDELKTNITVRGEYTMSAAWALGRKTDELIIDAWAANATTVTAPATGLTVPVVDELRETLDSNDVPFDGRWATVGPAQVSDLLALAGDEFISSELRGSAGPASANAGNVLGMWRGFTWMMFTGLPFTTGVNRRTIFAGHPSASGLAIGKEITTTIDWIPEKVAHLINAKMSMGAVVIDEPGILQVDIDE